jgi:hypothetical protein
MDIHDAVDTAVFILKGDIVLNSSQIVTQMLPPSRPGAGKNTLFH